VDGKGLSSSAARPLDSYFLRRRHMSRYRRRKEKPQQNPQRAKEAADPDPGMTAQVPRDEPKGDPSSRLETSNEPAEDDEKRQAIEKLKEREQGS
jgi:hypothetical protein